MERAGHVLGDDFSWSSPGQCFWPMCYPHGAGTSSQGYPCNALQRQPSLPGSCMWEAEGPVPAVGLEWLQGKPGTCNSLGKGRGEPGQQSPRPPRVCTVGAKKHVCHSSGSTEVGALKPHTGIYIPPPQEEDDTWRMPACCTLPHALTHLQSSPFITPNKH